MKQRIHQIELFLKFPHEVQNDWLKKLLFLAQDTEYGKKYDFKNIKTYEDFCDKVPIVDYEGLKPYVHRMMAGEQNLIWPRDIKWFAKSSGTTNDKSKFIPVTTEALEECHFKGGKDMLSIYCNNNPETKIFSGKGLALGGSHQISSFNTDTYYGDLSAILLQNLPYWAQFIRTPDLSIALMDNWEEKIVKLAERTTHENVTNLAGVPTWTLVLARQILESNNKQHLLEVWPHLELFVHGAVNFTPYRQQFEKLIPSTDFNYLETYNASEGFFAIQDENNSDEMLLMLDYGIFYEFIAMDQFDGLDSKTINLSQVELNKNYALLITTNAGLWRYMIGDTISFTSLSPYRLKITGRTKHFINAFGEELIIDNAESAITEACRQTNAVVAEYTAAPIYFGDSTSASHEWLIEFKEAPGNIEDFISVLDDTLKMVNSDYEAKRVKNIALKRPVIKVLPSNTFYNWLREKGKLGGQHKVPRLSNNRQYVDEILASCSL